MADRIRHCLGCGILADGIRRYVGGEVAAEYHRAQEAQAQLDAQMERLMEQAK